MKIVNVVASNPCQLRGLVSYDPLRIGASLRWIDEAVIEGGVAGAYAEAECCSAGLNAPRMYPLYGLCSMLRMPVVFGFHSHESWAKYLEAEVVAADFPDLDIVLAPPPEVGTASILRMLQRFPRISFLLCPQDLLANAGLCEYIELQGREHTLFRSSAKGWMGGGDSDGTAAWPGSAACLSFRKRDESVSLCDGGREPQRRYCAGCRARTCAVGTKPGLPRLSDIAWLPDMKWAMHRTPNANISRRCSCAAGRSLLASDSTTVPTCKVGDGVEHHCGPIILYRVPDSTIGLVC